MEPRIKISYDIEENGALVKKELPFTIGIIADFSGNNSPYATTKINSRDFIPLQLNSINQIIAQIKPGLSFKINSDTLINKNIDINLTFSSLEDFKPEALVEQIPELNELKKLRDQLKEQQIKQSNDSTNIVDTTLIDKAKQLLGKYMGDHNVI